MYDPNPIFSSSFANNIKLNLIQLQNELVGWLVVFGGDSPFENKKQFKILVRETRK